MGIGARRDRELRTDRGFLLVAPGPPRPRPPEPGERRATRATFTIRSPVRPNPIGTSIVTLVAREGAVCMSVGSTASTGRPFSISNPNGRSFAPRRLEDDAAARRSLKPRARKCVSRRARAQFRDRIAYSPHELPQLPLSNRASALHRRPWSAPQSPGSDEPCRCTARGEYNVGGILQSPITRLRRRCTHTSNSRRSESAAPTLRRRSRP